MDSCQPSDNGVSTSNILFVHKFLSSLSCFQSTTETEKCKQEQRAHQHTLKTVSAAAAHSSLKSQDSTHLQEAARCGTNPQQSPHNSSIVGGGLMLLARNWNDRPPPFPDYRAHIPVAQTSKQNKHHEAKYKAIFPMPDPATSQLAAGKRSHDGCQPGTICGHSALTRSPREYLLSPVRPAASRRF